MKKNKWVIMTFLSVIFLFFTSCGQENVENNTQKKWEKSTQVSQDTLFPNGMKVQNDNFVWDVYLTMLSTDPTGEFNTQTYNVEFKAGSRTNWHSHPGGQILIATQWIGYYQEKWWPIKEVHVWETIECPKDIPHWHGASPHSDFSHIWITTNVDAGAPNWWAAVTQQEYNSYDPENHDEVSHSHQSDITDTFEWQFINQTQKSISEISSYTAIWDIPSLETSIIAGLDNGLTINQIKEIILHSYAYVWFPRSLNAMSALQTVLEQRQQQGIEDPIWESPNIIDPQTNRFQAWAQVQTQLVWMSFNYEFMTGMDEFLKEHLFADLFLRWVLTYQQRELVTIAALTTLDGAESQLWSHIRMWLNTWLTIDEIEEVVNFVWKNINIDKSNVVNQFK